MCIAIMQPAGTRLTEAKARESFLTNPHGAGYMYAHDGKLVVKKAYYTFQELWAELQPDLDQYAETCPFVIHMRIRTHGDNSPANIHPHIVNDDMAFVHNGIIQISGSKENESDTATFNRLLLQEMPKNFLENKAIRTLISDFVSSSKLVFLQADGTWDIINAKLGHWNKSDGLWYSNHGYCETQYSQYYYTGGYGSKSKKNGNAKQKSGTGTSSTRTSAIEGSEGTYGFGEYDYTDDMCGVPHDINPDVDWDSIATDSELKLEEELFYHRGQLGDMRERIKLLADDAHDRCDCCGTYVEPYEARMVMGNYIICSVDCLLETKQTLDLP